MFLVYIVHPLLLKGNSNFETKGLFTKREEDPRRRNNFSFALHAEISVGVYFSMLLCTSRRTSHSSFTSETLLRSWLMS